MVPVRRRPVQAGWCRTNGTGASDDMDAAARCRRRTRVRLARGWLRLLYFLAAQRRRLTAGRQQRPPTTGRRRPPARPAARRDGDE